MKWTGRWRYSTYVEIRYTRLLPKSSVSTVSTVVSARHPVKQSFALVQKKPYAGSARCFCRSRGMLVPVCSGIARGHGYRPCAWHCFALCATIGILWGCLSIGSYSSGPPKTKNTISVSVGETTMGASFISHCEWSEVAFHLFANDSVRSFIEIITDLEVISLSRQCSGRCETQREASW